MPWQVTHEQSGRPVGLFKTKKAAAAAATEAQDAHAAVKAQHDGQPVTFTVAKTDEPAEAQE